MKLADAQRERRARAQMFAEARTAAILDAVGLSEADIEQFGTADVSPAARKKLEPIINALRKDPRPFTKCMKNLRDEQPGWSEDRRRKTCNVLKALAGRQNGGSTKASLALADSNACVLVDDDVAALLEHVDEEVLAVNVAAAELGEDFAFKLFTKKTKDSLPGQAFVFAGKRKYPIHDINTARTSLARAKGTAEEDKVKAAVYKRFPQLRKLPPVKNAPAGKKAT